MRFSLLVLAGLFDLATMCQLHRNPPAAVPADSTIEVKPTFSCRRLNPTTFVLTEDDKWGENPQIYVKVHDRHLVIIDSGCGGSDNTPNRDVTLKQFLETVPVPDNGNEVLNPSGSKAYTLVFTHSHYDHIAGVPEFNSVPGFALWASALGKSYMTDPDKLYLNSLCKYVGMDLPQFSVTRWVEDNVRVTAGGVDRQQDDLGLVIYQTPGHVADQVAIWDPEERFLYVGDTVYEDSPVLFPEGGSFFSYRDTIRRLRGLVEGWNAEAGPAAGRVKLAAGHITLGVDAADLLDATDSFVSRVLSSEVPAVNRTDNSPYFGGQPAVEYKNDNGSVSFTGLRKSFENLS